MLTIIMDTKLFELRKDFIEEVEVKLKTVLTFSAVIASAYALGNLLVPEILLTMYGLENNPGMRFESRLFGAALAGFAVITWQARELEASKARDSLVAGMTIFTVGGLIVSLLALLDGTMNPLGWSAIIIFGGLALGFFVTGRDSLFK